MAYLTPTALRNLKKYAYKAVDKCVYSSLTSHCILTILQITYIPICSGPILELVHHSLAADSRTKYSTPYSESLNNAETDAWPR